MISQGGYLPQIDHQVPPDVPLRTLLLLLELIAKLQKARISRRDAETLEDRYISRDCDSINHERKCIGVPLWHACNGLRIRCTLYTTSVPRRARAT